MKKDINLIILIIFSVFAFHSCVDNSYTEIENSNLILQVNEKLETAISTRDNLSTPLSSGFQESEYIVANGNKITNFQLTSKTSYKYKNKLGTGTTYEFKGSYTQNGLMIEKLLSISTNDSFPNMVLTSASYINKAVKSIKISSLVNNCFEINTTKTDTNFWSFQGSSTSARADWILPVQEGFKQNNYMGMNSSDYGGGIPVVDIWRSDIGIAIGHTSMHPELVSLPVNMEYTTDNVSICVEKSFDNAIILKQGDTISTLETFVMLHNGDCYNSLKQYGLFMRKKGLNFAKPVDGAYEPVWCAWGYERGFTLDEIIGTLPKVKELGFKWVVLDDGFQIAEGDWNLNKTKFPGGNEQMKSFVDKIHSYGLKAKLWWAPLAVDPCTVTLEENPDIILFNEDWSPRFITWWDAYYMAPTYSKTINHTKDVINMFIVDWGFDGLKMDGQHMNAVPPDYNPAHNLSYPEESAEKLPEFFEMVYNTTTALKPEAVIENCPCGCCMSFYNMPYMNQAVSSDPLSSWQIRLKGKVYKALIGKTAYYGDHVELSDNANDFASSFGIGAVLGSKFTWPKDNPSASGIYLLTPEKEIIWKKWISLYNEKMLSKEDYLGDLYDIGFDKPETHAISKGDTVFYAFYADNWDGNIELLGLDSTINYTVNDYFNNIIIDNMVKGEAKINVNFTDFLLLEVYPN